MYLLVLLFFPPVLTWMRYLRYIGSDRAIADLPWLNGAVRYLCSSLIHHSLTCCYDD